MLLKDADADGPISVLEEVGSIAHEHEELKAGVWLEPDPALLRKKVWKDRTEKHRNVAGKMFLEGGWTQKKLFDIGWSDVSQCQACQMEKGPEKHRLCHCLEWPEIRREIAEAFKKCAAKGEKVEERMEVAKRYRRAPSQ